MHSVKHTDCTVVNTPIICSSYTITAEDADSAMRFGEEMTDSRLTEPSEEKIFRLREAILLSKRLERPLTKDELQEFVI